MVEYKEKSIECEWAEPRNAGDRSRHTNGQVRIRTCESWASPPVQSHSRWLSDVKSFANSLLDALRFAKTTFSCFYLLTQSTRVLLSQDTARARHSIPSKKRNRPSKMMVCFLVGMWTSKKQLITVFCEEKSTECEWAEPRDAGDRSRHTNGQVRIWYAKHTSKPESNQKRNRPSKMMVCFFGTSVHNRPNITA